MKDIEPYIEGLYPRPGTQEIKDFIDNSYPRKKNEKKATHHRRIARELGFERLSRIAELYGDPRARIHQDEIEKIFHCTAFLPRKDQVSSQIKRLEQAEIRDDQFNQIIGEAKNEIATLVLRKIAESLMENLPRSVR